MKKSMIMKSRGGRDGLLVAECFNLMPMPGSEGDVLVPAGAPKVIAGGGWRPVAVFGDDVIVSGKNADGSESVGVVRGGEVTVLDELPAGTSVVSAMVCGDTVTLMTGRGPWTLRRGGDGDIVSVGPAPEWPQIAVTAGDTEMFTRTFPGGKPALTAVAAAECYRGLAEDIAAAGLFMQPVLARCRVLDREGRTLYVTAPQTVMLPEGSSLASVVRVNMPDGESGDTAGGSLSAPGYALKVTVGGTVPEVWRTIADRLVVKVSEEFHPCDFSDTASVAVSRRLNTCEAVITLGGIGRGITAARGLSSRERIMKAYAHADEILTPAMTFHTPFSGEGGTTFTVRQSAGGDLRGRAVRLDAILDRRPGARDSVCDRLSVPHSFTAVSCAVNGRGALWANPVALPFGGYGIGDFAAQTEGRVWTGSVRVDFADGSSVTRNTGGNFAPVSSGPVLSYPRADAVAMTFTLSDGSTGTGMSEISVRLPLTADPSGRYALYIHAGLKAWHLSDEAEGGDDTLTDDQAEDVTADTAMKGYVVSCAAGAPSDVRGVHSVGGNIRALAAARSTAGAWDYGRSRFYVFCDDGTRLLVLDAAMTGSAVTVLDTGTADGALCVCEGGDGVYMLSGRRILRLAGSRVTALPGDFDGDRLGCTAGGEIIVGNTDDNEATAVLPDYGFGSYRFALVLREGWLSAAGRVLAVSDTGAVDVGQRESAVSTYVRWRARWCGERRRPLPASLLWPIKAVSFDGRLTVSRSWLTGTPPTAAVISRATVKGAVRSPVRVPLAGHGTYDMVLTVDGYVSRDFAMTVPVPYE